MSLADHLRELRRRVVITAVALVVGGSLGWWQYSPLIKLMEHPLLVVAAERGRSSLVDLNFATNGVTQAFSIKLKVALFVGIILSSPVWLYQVWGFIVPGLTSKEKRVSLAFIAAAVPLFLGGCVLATWALPRAVEVLLGDFVPQGAAILPDASVYFTFVTRFILAFGLAFLLPVFLVGLNTAHILPARVMIKGWRVAIMVIAVFAAVMTPTPDAWTMLALMLPMVALYYGAVGVSWLLDRRRAKNAPDWMETPDDQASSIGATSTFEGPSSLDDDTD